ncbi:unnamed protein product, partial [Scytosiphon promiscuus]
MAKRRTCKESSGTGLREGAVSNHTGSFFFSHSFFKVDFLEARDAWLADSASRAGLAGAAGDLQRHSLGVASGSAASSPYQALMDLIESSRSQWFEVATQFRAIFLSGLILDRVLAGGRAGARSAEGASPSATRGTRAMKEHPPPGDVLSLWLLRRVSAFVEQLKGVLPLIEDGGLLRSLLEECMFFGASMGRLGTDFRGLLVPVFEDRVSGAAAAQWATASAEFVTTLRDIAAIEVAGGNGSSLLYVPDKTAATAAAAAAASVVAGDGDNKKAALLSVGGGDGGVPSPPRSLMAFPPVARLLNLVLTSFNQLRECLPSSLEDRLADSLVLCFTEVFRGLADLTKTTLRANAASDAATPAGAVRMGCGGAFFRRRGERGAPRCLSSFSAAEHHVSCGRPCVLRPRRTGRASPGDVLRGAVWRVPGHRCRRCRYRLCDDFRTGGGREGRGESGEAAGSASGRSG